MPSSQVLRNRNKWWSSQLGTDLGRVEFRVQRVHGDKSEENLSPRLTANRNFAAVTVNSSPRRKVPYRLAKTWDGRGKVKESLSGNEK